jgi:hypothetical protein
MCSDNGHPELMDDIHQLNPLVELLTKRHLPLRHAPMAQLYRKQFHRVLWFILTRKPKRIKAMLGGNNIIADVNLPIHTYKIDLLAMSLTYFLYRRLPIPKVSAATWGCAPLWRLFSQRISIP